jgi:hypothetical protein
LFDRRAAFDLAFALEDGSASGPLLDTAVKAAVVGHSVFAIRGNEQRLWRVDVPQP